MHAGDWAQAEMHFTTAAATAERIGAAPELARTQFDHARMLTARGGLGDRERAAALLGEAHGRFQALGLRPLVVRAAALAERLGVAVPSARVADAGTLSPPDLDVLRRVAQGRGVREIADALTVAPASAEQRIRSLLQKIGAHTDSALPAEPLRRGDAQGAAPRPHPLVIMFTDMEGSTAAIQRLGDATARGLLRAHDAIIRAALVRHGGAEVNHTGDGVMATFPSASSAIACAVAMQKAFAQHSRAHPKLAIRVRIGLNAGEPLAEGELIFGIAVNLAARICARARGGQILVADVVRQLAVGRGVRFVDRRRKALKGFQGRYRLFEVPWDDAESPASAGDTRRA
jgi:class 3 adenylate cyclase